MVTLASEKYITSTLVTVYFILILYFEVPTSNHKMLNKKKKKLKKEFNHILFTKIFDKKFSQVCICNEQKIYIV